MFLKSTHTPTNKEHDD